MKCSSLKHSGSETKILSLPQLSYPLSLPKDRDSTLSGLYYQQNRCVPNDGG
jgi:hypothetical protein